MIETPEEFAFIMDTLEVLIDDRISSRETRKAKARRITARDAAIRTDEQQKAAKKKAELLDAAKAYKDLCACYRIGKQPTEKLFSRLEKANAAIMAEAKEAQR